MAKLRLAGHIMNELAAYVELEHEIIRKIVLSECV